MITHTHFSHLELMTDEAITQNKVFLYSLFAIVVINKTAVSLLDFYERTHEDYLSFMETLQDDVENERLKRHIEKRRISYRAMNDCLALSNSRE